MMKKIINLFYTGLILGIVFLFGMTTGNHYFAAGLTGVVTIFSMLYHAGALGSKLAFEAPIVPEFEPLTQKAIDELEPEAFQEYLDKKEAYDKAVAAKATYDQIEELKSTLTEENKAQVNAAIEKLEDMLKENQNAVENTFLMIKAMREGATPHQKKESLRQLIEKNSDTLKAIKEKHSKGETAVGSTGFSIDIATKAELRDRDWETKSI